jgi:hypothetical protein
MYASSIHAYCDKLADVPDYGDGNLAAPICQPPFRLLQQGGSLTIAEPAIGQE